jgi:hypothetical protein
MIPIVLLRIAVQRALQEHTGLPEISILNLSQLPIQGIPHCPSVRCNITRLSSEDVVVKLLGEDFVDLEPLILYLPVLGEGGTSIARTKVRADKKTVSLAKKKKRNRRLREKRKSESPDEIISSVGLVWSKESATTAREPNYVGCKETTHIVDTNIYSYRLTCVCGRVRFAKRNCIDEITCCRICQAESRKAKKRKRT